MTDSLKKMLSSVDWSKAMTGGDARNALIGSALGGLMLGGASMASERDPEESKLTPVNDALMGALLGGAAGYGIPKGLALFSDAGSLAPDDDKLKYNFGRAAAGGATAGTAALGGFSLFPAFKRGMSKARGQAIAGTKSTLKTIPAELAKLDKFINEGNRVAAIQAIKDSTELQDYLAATGGSAYYDRLGDLQREIRGTKDAQRLGELKKVMRDLIAKRKMATRGYTDLSDLMERFIVNDHTGQRTKSIFGKLLDNRLVNWISRGDRNAAKPLFGTWGAKHLGRFGKTLSPRARLLVRGGKWAAGGAALATLLHLLSGPSASRNTSK